MALDLCQRCMDIDGSLFVIIDGKLHELTVSLHNAGMQPIAPRHLEITLETLRPVLRVSMRRFSVAPRLVKIEKPELPHRRPLMCWVAVGTRGTPVGHN